MRVCYAAGYNEVDLPDGHPFPMSKFAHLHAILLAENLIRSDDVVTPNLAAIDDLRLIHTEAYVRQIATGEMPRAAERRLGLPWSPQLWRRSRLAVDGTCRTARMAIEDGIAGNLAGGTHHACPDYGEGFCIFNDVGIATRVLQREGLVRRVLIVDLDVHHGNGNAVAFGPSGGNDPDVFTFSMHGAKNFPVRKPPSDLDVGLPDGTDDEAYMAALEENLPAAINAARPELVFYLAGVDPVAGDRYGRLALTPEGLRARDSFVLDVMKQRGLRTALLLSGGYASTPFETANLHAMMFREAAAL